MDQLKIARTLEEATPALQPERPLESGDPRWEDFTPGRGTNAVSRLLKVLNRNPGGEFSRLVFTSHRGAGKSTELKRLKHELRHKYLCIYLEANVEMHATRIEIEDLLLVLAKAVTDELSKMGRALDKQLIGQVHQWFADTIESTSVGRTYLGKLDTSAKAGIKIPFLQLMAQLTALMKAESKHKVEIKETLKKFPGSLMDAMNQLLDAANEHLTVEGKQLLIMIDNMDRYNPAIIDELITRNADRFQRLHCNLLLTPPISLIYRPESATLEQNYICFTLPTIKLRDSDKPYTYLEAKGRNLLLSALAKRIDLDALIPEAAARDKLVFGSGGSIRGLLELAYDATLEAESDTITQDDMVRVLGRRRHQLRDRMNANGLAPALVFIAANHQLNDDPKCLQAMHLRLAFMYNGDGWHDIHPLLSSLDPFKQERSSLESST